VADRARRVLRDAGARGTAIWPDEASLSIWALPPGRLTTTLLDLIEHGTGSAAYYRDVMEAVVSLAVSAPGGPPSSTADFLARLDAEWLATAYSDGEHASELAMIRSAGRQAGDVALRFRALFRRLGPGLDGPGTFADADAWYCILEGTREPSVAEAQAMALTELTAHAATDLDSEPRAMLLAADDYSAVSGRVPLSNLYERGRSLGIGVQVSAQSWQGLGRDDDERYRIAATADGGIWLMRTPYPQPVCELAGTRRVIETATKVVGGMWGDEGSSRVQHAWTADPAIARRLAVGQAGYIHAGGCTWVQIARPRPSPIPIPAPPPPPVVIAPAPAREQAPAAVPPAPARDLDDVFGPETRP
jgi:hypothetical protein